jgi:hypothetical protein
MRWPLVLDAIEYHAVLPDDGASCLHMAYITIMARPPILMAGPLTCTFSVGVAVGVAVCRGGGI